MEAAVDAGPLIHLHEIGGLTLLNVFDRLHVPEVVWTEAVGRGRVPEAVITALHHVERYKVSRRKVTAFIDQQGLTHLHAGEQACLYLCREALPISLILTDDLAVREVAHELGLIPVGSLGIVVRAYRLGRIAMNEAERFILNLQDQNTLFVTPTIVEMAIEQLRLHDEGG